MQGDRRRALARLVAASTAAVGLLAAGCVTTAGPPLQSPSPAASGLPSTGPAGSSNGATGVSSGPTGAGTSRPTPSGGGRPPNILVILTDDQRFDTLGAMPKTERIFRNGGVSYPNAVVVTPLCCPSRSTIMTGRYPHDTGVHGNADASKLDQSTTVQRYLHDAGYQTGIVGKFLNDWPLDQIPADFDRAAVFDHGYLDTEWGIDGQVATIPEYSTSYIRDQALADLRAFSSDRSRPWYLYVATSAPHDPWVPEPKYAGAPVPPFVRDPAMKETDRSDKPPWVLRAPHLGLPTIAANRASQLRTLRSVDDLVGSLFAELDRLGESRDTLAFFLSDNGFLWGEHGLAGDKGELESGSPPQHISGKRYPYLPSVRIPMAIRWPGHVRAGQVVSGYATTTDLAPTMLQAAGVATPSDPPMDGSPLLVPGNTGATEARTQAYMEYFHDPLYPAVPSWGSILTPAAHYIEWYAPTGSVIFREYYDLTKDPFELNNLLANADPSDDPDVSSLDAQLAHDRSCEGLTGPKACPSGSAGPAP